VRVQRWQTSVRNESDSGWTLMGHNLPATILRKKGLSVSIYVAFTYGYPTAHTRYPVPPVSEEEYLHQRQQRSAEEGCNQEWIGDGYCDDINNTLECTYDGGDCCGDTVNTQYCSECQCLEGGK